MTVFVSIWVTRYRFEGVLTESAKAEEEGLHKNREGELDMDMLDVMYQTRNNDASNELSSADCSLARTLAISTARYTYPEGIEYTPILIGSAV